MTTPSRDVIIASGVSIAVKCGITSRPKSSSDRIATSCGNPKLAP